MEFIEPKKQIHKHISEYDSSYAERQVSSSNHSRVFASMPVKNYEKWKTSIEEKQTQLGLYESGYDVTKEIPDEAREFQIKNLKREIAECQEYQEGNNQQFQWIFSSLGAEIKKMYEDNLSNNQRNKILSKIHKMFLKSKYVDEFKSHFNEEVTVKQFIQNLEDKVYSPELLYDVAKGWQEEFASIEEKFQVWAEKAKNSFVQRVTECVNQGKLPEEALENIHRVHSVKFVLQDCFPFFVSNSTLGEHNPDTGVGVNLRLFITEDSSDAVHTVFHELLHSISGSTINEVSDGEGDRNRFIHRKSGLNIVTNAKAVTFPRNRWLNEAVTEKLTKKLLEKTGTMSDNVVYQDEQTVLNELLTNGLSENLVLRAYFENITDGTAPEQKAPMFAKLVKKINVIKGEYGFTKLDNEDIAKQLVQDLEETGYLTTQAHFRDIQLKPDTKKFTVRIRVGKNTKGAAYLDMLYLKANEVQKTPEEWSDEIETVIKKAIGLKYSRHYSLEVSEFVDGESLSQF